MLSILSILSTVSAEQLVLPEGQLKLGAKLFDASFSAVYLVTDSKNTPFNLRVGIAPAAVDESVRKAFVQQFETEMKGYEEVTNALCPGLLGSSSSPFACERRSVDVMLAKNVAIVDASGQAVSVQTTNMDLDEESVEDLNAMEAANNVSSSFVEIRPSAEGKSAQLTLAMDFTKNILTPAFAGRSLAEVVSVNPLYSELSNRFGLYIAALSELTESVRLLHNSGLVHLNLAPENVVCKGKWCEHMLIEGHSRVLRTEGTIPEAAHEVYQSAIAVNEIYQSADPRATAKAIADKSKLQGWEDVKTVDWYSLGGTLYYVLSGDSASIEDLRASPTTVSDYFLNNMAPQTLPDLAVVEAGIKKAEGDSSPAPTAAEVADVKKKITEALVVLDGLLQEKRESRLNLDKQKRDAPVAVQPSLRKGGAQFAGASGFVEIRKANALTGVSCGEFVEKVARSSKTIVEHNLSESLGVASFLQDVC